MLGFRHRRFWRMWSFASPRRICAKCRATGLAQHATAADEARSRIFFVQKNGLNTWREALRKPCNGWKQQKSNAGSKNTEE